MYCSGLTRIRQPLMQIVIFKTNVKTRENADMVIDHITRMQPVGRVNFDLGDCDKILRIEAEEIQAQSISKLLLDLGFSCVLLE